jgi:hypothetical protein
VALNGLSDPEGNLGDANRYYCPKYEPSSTAIYASDLAYYKELAVQAGAPLFICELWVAQSGTNDQIVSEQEAVDNALDQAMVGGVQIQYPFGSGYSMLNPDGSEVFWIPEFARPYPEWVGGTLSSVQEDFASSTLTVGLKLDSSGPTDIYTSETRNYPSGFVATDSAGDYLTFDGNNVLSASGMFWDGYDQYVVLLPKTGPLTFTLKPLTPSALAALARRVAAVRYHPACHGCQ